MNKKIKKLLTIALMAVFVVSIVMMVLQRFDYIQGDDSYSAAQDLVAQAQAAENRETTPPTETEPVPTEGPRYIWVPAPVEEDPAMEELQNTDLSVLREVNADVVGWITIPDTKVNYPLMQGEDNEYYLHHTWDHVQNDVGSIFLESLNSPDLTDFNTLIYGHNMRNGSMFGKLHYFAYPDYVSEHPYVYIVTDAGIYRYEIFASYLAEVDSQTYGLSFNQLQTREDFIALALEKSEVDTGITPNVSDRIITLSTCGGWGYETRWVIHARMEMIRIEA